MKILAIDTSGQALSLALKINDQTLSHHSIVPMQQAQLILPEIKKLLAEADVKLQQLDVIAFGRGPGSFTGVRIAASIAQGLSFGAQLPVIAISSLAALAQSAYLSWGWPHLLVAIDARMQEIYWATYAVHSTGLVGLIGDEIVRSPTEIPSFDDQKWAGIGNGWEVYREQISYQPKRVDSACLPTATAILDLASDKWLKKEDLLNPEEALPVYLRENVAKKSK